MYELNRILLRNFGPHDARYENVPLDFSGAGVEVETASLVPDAGHVTHRPSPASLVMLQNGGGKGVLLTGITCTTIPYRHSELAALRKFVVSKAQPSHVVLEWADARTGRLLVTAQILAPDHDGKLHRCFYSFHPSAALDADRLPFHRDGHWVPFDDYLTELRDCDKRVDALELRIIEGQEKWEKHQHGLGLQPDLFDVQRRMNAKESDAAAAFTTHTADAFVEWLLRKATDDDRYAELGTAFHSYAAAHDERAQWERERQFALEMRQACDDVAGLHDALTEHAGAAKEAERDLVRFTAALRARHAALTAATAEDESAVKATHRAHDDAKRAREVAASRLRHVQAHSHTLELDEISRQQAEVQDGKARAEDQSTAWHSVPIALRHTQAVENHDRAQQALIKAEHTAAPYVQAVDAAAAALRAGYQLAEKDARTTIRTHEAAASQAKERIDQWRTRSNALLTTAGAAQEESRTLRERTQVFAARLSAARAEDLLTPQESAADAAARAQSETHHSEQLLREAKLTRASIRAERDRSHKALTEQEKLAWSAREKSEAAEKEIGQLRTRAEAVRDNPLCAELLEAGSEELRSGDALPWLHAQAAGLHQLAERRVSGLDTALTQARMDLRHDQDLLSLLDTSEGLLPSSQEVRDLCGQLSRHSIHAVPGWQWMRDNVPAAEHQQIISAHPDLAGGIIVGGPDGLESAKNLMERLRPLPSAAVTVGTGERMLRSPTALDEDRFVVEPSPALHDEEAAARERTEVEARITAGQGELDTLGQRISAARNLVRQIVNWREACGESPVPHRLKQLADLQNAAEGAQNALAAARTAVDGQEAALEDAEGTCERLDGQTRAAQRAADTLAQLAMEEAAAEQAEARIATLTAESATRTHELESLKSQITQAEDEGERHVRAIEAAEQEAHGYARAREAITTTAPAEQAHAALTAPLAPLPALQHRYQQAQEELKSVEVGEDQQQRADAAQQALLDSQESWNKVPARVQELALEYSHDARAGDEVQRNAVLRALATEIRSCAEALQELRDQASRLTERAAHLPPALPLSEEDAAAWTPGTVAEARDLTAKATGEYHEAQERERSAADAFNTARREQASSSRKLTAFDRVLPRLDTAVHDLAIPADVAAYGGTAEAAETTARRVTAAHTQSRNQARQAERRLESGVSRLKEVPADVRFERLDIPLRTQISALDSRHIPAMASTWTEALTSRIAALNSDLEGMAKAREALASQLGGHVTDLLQRLDQATRFSAFPDGDSPWSGQKYLTIRYKRPDLATLTAQMRESVDALAGNSRTRKLKGTDVVMRCLKDAVPRGFNAEVMKPNAAHRLDRVPVEDMAEVFSGGQELTGAILLYCTLAALRTSPGPRSRTRNGGLLLLDNPIGRANAGYLVDIQMEMAAALGIQLIYTTGLSDENVSSRFPLHIQLRNDAEARSGLSLIRLEDTVRNALIPTPRVAPDQDAPNPAGFLTSARLYRKRGDAR
ncbi:hypothetical protein [Streptomyces sp. NBC_00847]|uniref:hypothetical protein n=1 Tax=Streptomyces sp. NBC_00847 TaxID=2975850 RepID=UPI002252DA4C|nr:hypothetical protein [Streptomyces sp. NBC_00847]MCX4884664.1 hypothetical protein [Streptomyces sp. NBC_00847]